MASKVAEAYVMLRADSSQLTGDLARMRSAVASQMASIRQMTTEVGKTLNGSLTANMGAAALAAVRTTGVIADSVRSLTPVMKAASGLARNLFASAFPGAATSLAVLRGGVGRMAAGFAPVIGGRIRDAIAGIDVRGTASRLGNLAGAFGPGLARQLNSGITAALATPFGRTMASQFGPQIALVQRALSGASSNGITSAVAGFSRFGLGGVKLLAQVDKIGGNFGSFVGAFRSGFGLIGAGLRGVGQSAIYAGSTLANVATNIINPSWQSIGQGVANSLAFAASATASRVKGLMQVVRGLGQVAGGVVGLIGKGFMRLTGTSILDLVKLVGGQAISVFRSFRLGGGQLMGSLTRISSVAAAILQHPIVQGFGSILGGAARFAGATAKAWIGTFGAIANVAGGAAGFIIRGFGGIMSRINAVGNALGASLISSLGPIAMAGGLGMAVTTFASFEYEMARVGAVTNATAAEFDMLNAKARQLGRDTIFTASQAADAMGNMATAGFNANEIMQATGDTMNLAAASGMGMADTALIMARAIRSQKLQASDSGRVADVLTNAFNRSATSLPALGEAFRAVGPITHAAGMSLEETAAILMAFADVGIEGSSAGNNLKRILQRFVAEPATVAREFKRLGIDIADSQGRIRPMADIIDELRNSMAGMTDVERNAHVTRIAGLYAQNALTELLEVGGDRIRENTRLVSQHGAAAEFANQRMNTLTGAFDRMTSAINDTAIQLGGTLKPMIVGLFQGVQEIANSFTQWMDVNKELVQTVLGVGAAVGGLLIAMPLITGAISAMFGPVGLAIGAIAGITLAVQELGIDGSSILQQFSSALSVVGGFFQSMFTAMRPVLETIGLGIIHFFDQFTAFLLRNQQTVSNWGMHLGEIFSNLLRLGGQIVGVVARIIGGFLGVDGSKASWDSFATTIETLLDRLSFWTTDFERSWDLMVTNIGLTMLNMLNMIDARMGGLIAKISSGPGGLSGFFGGTGSAGGAMSGFFGNLIPNTGSGGGAVSFLGGMFGGFFGTGGPAAGPVMPGFQGQLQEQHDRLVAQIRLMQLRGRLLAQARQLGANLNLPELVGNFDPIAAAALLEGEWQRLELIRKNQMRLAQIAHAPGGAEAIGVFGAAGVAGIAGLFEQRREQGLAEQRDAVFGAIGGVVARGGQAVAEKGPLGQGIIDATAALLAMIKPAAEEQRQQEAKLRKNEIVGNKDMWAQIQTGLSNDPTRMFQQNALRQGDRQNQLLDQINRGVGALQRFAGFA